jgi:hypothetical protein
MVTDTKIFAFQKTGASYRPLPHPLSLLALLTLTHTPCSPPSAPRFGEGNLRPLRRPLSLVAGSRLRLDGRDAVPLAAIPLLLLLVRLLCHLTKTQAHAHTHETRHKKNKTTRQKIQQTKTTRVAKRRASCAFGVRAWHGQKDTKQTVQRIVQVQGLSRSWNTFSSFSLAFCAFCLRLCLCAFVCACVRERDGESH